MDTLPGLSWITLNGLMAIASDSGLSMLTIQRNAAFLRIVLAGMPILFVVSASCPPAHRQIYKKKRAHRIDTMRSFLLTGLVNSIGQVFPVSGAAHWSPLAHPISYWELWL